MLDGRRVLVVEDGVANRRLLEAVFRDAGAEVVGVENGQVDEDHHAERDDYTEEVEP